MSNGEVGVFTTINTSYNPTDTTYHSTGVVIGGSFGRPEINFSGYGKIGNTAGAGARLNVNLPLVNTATTNYRKNWYNKHTGGGSDANFALGLKLSGFTEGEMWLKKDNHDDNPFYPEGTNTHEFKAKAGGNAGLVAAIGGDVVVAALETGVEVGKQISGNTYCLQQYNRENPIPDWKAEQCYNTRGYWTSYASLLVSFPVTSKQSIDLTTEISWDSGKTDNIPNSGGIKQEQDWTHVWDKPTVKAGVCFHF